ncbi:unnamed protein product [Penicillium roqueforti FM164]|uniref:Genomic scaffold, ProqFM164S03 n=1 Tax=Penicillium roqueforti (strain FM164) TaxID=1365484 RepID=W6QB06_PENRF|nr:unnamed protein product [Penicillium roqueforti FM164]
MFYFGRSTSKSLYDCRLCDLSHCKPTTVQQRPNWDHWLPYLIDLALMPDSLT